MKLFAGRPLCFGCFFAAAASFFCAVFGWRTSLCVAAASVLLGAFAAVLFARGASFDKRAYFAALFIALFLVSASSGAYFYRVQSMISDTPAQLCGYVCPGDRTYNECTAVITSKDGAETDFKCFVKFPGKAPEDYTGFTATAAVAACEGEEARFLSGDGVFLQAELSGVKLGGTVRSAGYYIDVARCAVAARFYEVSDCGDLYRCIFLGQRDRAPRELKTMMRSLGTSHLLAVSGLHVTALLAGFSFILNGIFGRSRGVTAALAVIALFYMALAGFSGSVVRASLMFFIMSLGRLFSRRADSITDLMLAAVLILTAAPYAVYDAGFLLSASATAGIILLGAPVSDLIAGRLNAASRPLMRIPLYILSGLAVTSSAILFTLPVAAFYYGEAVLSALLNNLLISPFVMILLYACPYMLALSFIPGIGRLAGLFCDGISSLMMRVCSWLCGFSTYSVSLRYDFVKYVLAAFAAVLLIMMFAGVSRRRFYAAAAAVLIVSLGVGAGIYNADFAKKDVIIMESNYNGEILAVCSDGECTVFNLSAGGCYELSRELLRHGVTRVKYVACPKYTAFMTQQIPKDLGYLNAEALILPGCQSARLCESLCGRRAEYYEAGGPYKITTGRVDAETFVIKNGEKTYIALDLGGAVYTTYSPELPRDLKVMIYGTYAAIRHAEQKRADTEYFPEKYENKYKEKENAVFYGQITEITLQ